MGGRCLRKVVWEGLSKEVTFEWRPERKEGGHLGMARSYSRRGNGKCKGPEAGQLGMFEEPQGVTEWGLCR